jgi:hypothetical protein
MQGEHAALLPLQHGSNGLWAIGVRGFRGATGETTALGIMREGGRNGRDVYYHDKNSSFIDASWARQARMKERRDRELFYFFLLSAAASVA